MLGTAAVMGFLATTDAVRAEAFYVGILGLTRIEEHPAAPVPNANGTALRLQKAASFTPHPFTAFGRQVKDLAALVAPLAGRGGTFEHYGFPGQGADDIWSAPGGARIAWFKDPDGTLLSLTEPGQNT